ncbi:MAG: DUF1559 domain-containing protein [Planctomycetales bacterium]|nr:DUF1559 domain-containing protein [Planctomycetales bacterium]
MPLPFACPHCGELTLVDDEFAGHSGPCIGCGRTIVVPRFATPRPAGPAGAAIPASAYPGMPQVSPRKRLIFMLLVGIGATVAVGALITILFQPVLEYSRTGAHRRQCAENLRKIGVALRAYENKYGSLPPAYVEDKEGNRLHSWRVLILPFLGPEESELYGEYNLKESWDSPGNKLVADKMPSVFRCPADKPEFPENANETSYLVVVGKGTAFPGKTTVTRNDIGDNHRQTIYVLEANATKVVWTEPSDLSEGSQNLEVGTDVGGNHHGLNVLLSTGEVKFLPQDIDAPDLRAMTTINGNEPLPEY